MEEPYSVPDDLGWELMASVGDGLHRAALPRTVPPRPPCRDSAALPGTVPGRLPSRDKAVASTSPTRAVMAGGVAVLSRAVSAAAAAPWSSRARTASARAKARRSMGCRAIELTGDSGRTEAMTINEVRRSYLP